MRQVHSALSRCLMAVLVAMFVMGSLGMGAAGSATTDEPAHTMDHAAQPDSHCPTMDQTGAPLQKGHAACKMTICCFSQAPEFGALQLEARLLHAPYVRPVEARLTQAEPERAKKPPKHA